MPSRQEDIAAPRFVPPCPGGPEVSGRGPIYIYALCDPETNLIRYIGKSIRPRERLQNHINEPKSNCHRSHWIQSLKSRGLRPWLTILEEIDGEWPWQESERFWISYGRHHGWPLTNNTDGGDGVVNLPPEIRAKMRLTWLGRKHTPETRIKLCAAMRRRKPRSTESLEKSRQAMLGRIITWGDKISVSTRKIDAETSISIKSRLDAGELGKNLAHEFSVDRTTISKIKMGTYFNKYKRRTS